MKTQQEVITSILRRCLRSYPVVKKMTEGEYKAWKRKQTMWFSKTSADIVRSLLHNEVARGKENGVS